MTDSAAQIAQNLAAVKRDLAAVDQRIAEVTAELQRSTQALTEALAQAEHNIESLGVQMNRFPEQAAAQSKPGKKPPAAAPQPAARSAGSPRPRPQKPAGLSELLLDKLARMLGE